MMTANSFDQSPPGEPPGAAPPYSRAEDWRRARLLEGLGIWAISFAVLLLARYAIGPFVPFVAENLKAVAVIVFLYVPGWLIWKRGEDLADYGLTFRRWRRDLALGLGLAAIVFPLFALGFYGFVSILDHLPGGLAGWISPYRAGFDPAFRLPDGLLYMLLVHILVVALPEEFFYRGWLYSRLSEGLDEAGRGRRRLGVVIGPAFWITAILFAVGHLTEPYAWRLGVFFPALLFAWLRLRTGGLIAPIVFHGLSNVFVAILEASFFSG